MLLAIIKKEFILVRRDVHAVMVLFVMPMAFILIMSLSLQDTFEQDSADKPKIGVIFDVWEDGTEIVGEMFTKFDGFKVVTFTDKSNLKSKVQDEMLTAIVHVPHAFVDKLKADKLPGDYDLLTLYYPPRIPDSMRKLVRASVVQKLAHYQLEKILLPQISDPAIRKVQADKMTGAALIQESELYSGQFQQPSAVEQTVPSWLIFSMFFVVIPISTTFLTEKQLGTLQRLKTLPVRQAYFLVGKLIPYLLINLIQLVLMFMVGIFLMPLISGQGIDLGSNAWLLIPMSLSISVVAISFALLVATLVRTTEQATTIGGVSNLILGAIGGIMVPTFVMPEMMQTIAQYSPMNWGLEGFLTIILRQGSFTDILPELSKLLMLGMILFGLAVWFYRRTSVV